MTAHLRTCISWLISTNERPRDCLPLVLDGGVEKSQRVNASRRTAMASKMAALTVVRSETVWVDMAEDSLDAGYLIRADGS